MGARFQVYQLFQLFQFSAFFAQWTQEGRALRFAESPEQTVTVSNSIGCILYMCISPDAGCASVHCPCKCLSCLSVSASQCLSVSVSQLSQYLSLCFAYLVPPKKKALSPLLYI